jgi:hypothetical protein
VDHSIASLLAKWQNFYSVVGTSAGALTGLQFVVMTLIAQGRSSSNIRDIRAFGTPTLIHFCVALLISALMTAPWSSVEDFGICIGLCGLAAVAYSLRIFSHARKATYKPDLEDWIWYTAVPFLIYASLLACAILLRWRPSASLMISAAVTLAFVLLGVRNAWDTVTYIATRHSRQPGAAQQPQPDRTAR